MAEYENVPIGACTVPLDLGGQNLSIEQAETQVSDDFSLETTVLEDKAINRWAVVYLYDYVQPTPNSLSTEMLNKVMSAFCARINIKGYENGFIATGLYQSGGQKCWGVVLPVGSSRANTKRIMMIVAMFKDETLNERLVFHNKSFLS